MRTRTWGRLAAAVALTATTALGCDDESDATFILQQGDGTTSIIGSLSDLKRVRAAFRNDKDAKLWTRIDGEEYLVTDPALLSEARAIFARSEPLDVKQEALEREMEALEARQETVEGESDKLDDEQERVSARIERDLESLVRQAIRAGKAVRP